MIDLLTIVFFAVFGLLIGSFLNVCIYRLPREESVVWPASHCATCNRTLSWYENVPIVSWVVLRGRCRTCRTAIAPTYPIVEAVTGLVFVAGYLVYGWTPLLAVRLLFACALIVLFVIDLEHQILPNPITVPGTVLGFLFSLFLPPGWRSSLAGLLIGGLFPFVIAVAYAKLRGREGMGMGDFKMLAMVGAFLGWPLVWAALLLSCVLGIAIGGGALLVSRKGLGTRIPFGTFIAVSALICTLAGDTVQALYERGVDAYLTWAGLR